MQGLPFLVQPRQHPPRRVGTLDSGILEIPVLGGLTVEESNTITQLSADNVSAFVMQAQLADAIAQAEEITQPEAYAIVDRILDGASLQDKDRDIQLKYAERLERLNTVRTASGQRLIEISITAIIRHRLDRPDWTLEATRALPRVLLQDIWQLIADEQAAENLPSNRPSDDDLKKLRPVSGSSRKRTGKASTGGFVMPSQEPSPEQLSAVS